MAAALVMNVLSQFASPFLAHYSYWGLFICQFIVGISVSHIYIGVLQFVATDTDNFCFL